MTNRTISREHDGRDWKRRQIAYYDDQAEAGYAEKHYGDKAGEGYRANYFRVQKLLALLHAHPGTVKVLDVGCGDGWPLLCMLRDRFDARGFDLSAPMVHRARERLNDHSYERGRVWQGDAEEPHIYTPPDNYDAVISLGVFPHSREELTVTRNMAAVLRPGGLWVGEFRNALFSMFSLNAYSYQFWEKEFLPDDESQIGKTARELLRQRFGVAESPKTTEPRTTGDPDYNKLEARFHTPFAVNKLLLEAGLTPGPVLYYHFHAAPPELRLVNPAEFDRLSKAIEFTRERDWRGMFQASAFLATAYKPPRTQT